MLKTLHTLTLAGLLWSLPGCAHNVQLASLAGANAIEGKAPTIPGLELCGTLKLPSQWPANSLASGQPLGGLSALVWDDDEKVLWLISDRGRLHQTKPIFDDGQLIDLAVVSSHTLKDSSGQPLAGGDGDAEAVVLDNAVDGERGNTALLIAFERDHRLQQFTTEGYPRGDALHPNEAQSAGRNTGMEAMTRLPGLDVLIGLESPPPGSDPKITRLFTLDGRHQWDYPLAGATGSALTDMAPWPNAPDTLLTLERAYAPPHPLVITLKRTQLLAPPQVHVTTVASLSSADGWRLDNMEGLAALADGHFLMLSDNNFSRLQRSLLTCLRPVAQ